jgi:histidinol-phosphate aminotransferase
MNNLDNIIRKNIRDMKPYSSARDEFKGEDMVFLDANESPFGDYNRYPDPQQLKLKEALANIKNVSSANLFLGNGSDELLDLLIRIFCNPGVDKIACFTPTYGMYEVLANLNDVAVKAFPLDQNFQISSDSIDQVLDDSKVKIVFICSPNNPTGNLISEVSIERICKAFKGIVVIDEAYIDFTNSSSWSQKINDFPNLVIAQTLSKAYGLAGLRIGLGIASAEIIQILNKVKAPYNMNALSQQYALEKGLQIESIQEEIAQLIIERESLTKELTLLKIVQKVYPSEANFILAAFYAPNQVFQSLLNAGIIVRNRTKEVENCLRISIGNPVENKLLINTLKQIKS